MLPDDYKEEIIEEIKRELLLGQLKRNIVVTQEFAILTKGNKILDAEGLRVLSYTESVLKDVSQENSKPVKIC